MDISWVGHACFWIRTGNVSVLFDPFPPSLGIRVPPNASTPSIVTVSSTQERHSSLQIVGGKPTILNNPGEYEVSGLHIKGLRTSLVPFDVDEEPDIWNTIFIVETEGLTVCHLGSLNGPLTARQIEELSSPHILLVPIGGHGSLTAASAAELVNTIEPKIFIPMVYAQPGTKAELEPLSTFTTALSLKEPEPQPRLQITKGTLPVEPEIAVLSPTATLI